MRVAVTGGAGFIGSHLVDALVRRGDEVMVVDDESSGSPEQVPAGVTYVRADIRDTGTAAALREWRPHAVCHLAAQMSVSRSVREPLLDADVNVRGALNVLSAARDAGARLVFTSSGGALYGEASRLPTPETTPPAPVSPYAVSKLAFEHYLRACRAQHGLRYTVLRLANVYGPRQSPHGEAGVVAIFCDRLVRGGTSVINGDGGCTRDYVYVDDVVAAALAALDGDTIGPYNVGTGREVDVNRLYRLLAAAAGVDRHPEHGPARPGDVRASALDCGLIAAELGWRPRVALEDGLERTLAWFRTRAARNQPVPERA
jgi:UDP-glucose 4-epimerase